MAITNVNSETGIRFGTIYGNDCPNLMEAIFERGKDLSYEAYVEDLAQKVAGAMKEIGPYTGNEDDDHYSAQRIAPMVKLLKEHTLNTDIGHIRTAQDILQGMDDEIDDHGHNADMEKIAKEAVDNLDDIAYENDEPHYAYKDEDGNVFEMTCLGGAHLIFCKMTDKIIYVNRLCSPCVPNAGDLGSGIAEPPDGHQCYGVPDKYL